VTVISLRLCIVQPAIGNISETFLQAQADILPCETVVVHGKTPQIEGQKVLSESFPARAGRKLWRTLCGLPWQWDRQHAYATAFRHHRADVVLAQYGPTGTRVVDACRQTGIPLVVQFHGYDASVHEVIEREREGYHKIFRHAAAVVAVSRHMRDRLAGLGANPDTLYWNPYGVNVELFRGAAPAGNPPVFLAVGRLVPKKAPLRTIEAFANGTTDCPEAQLRIIGDGPLMDESRELASRLGVADRVVFLGAQPHDVVQQEMQRARAFVQHSVTADDGNCEGTPNSVLEASASGLPVIATRHAGIPDVIVEEETGLLVDEKDVDGMAEHMRRICEQPALAGELGQSGRQRIRDHFTMEAGIDRLWQILNGAATGQLPRPEAIAPEPIEPTPA